MRRAAYCVRLFDCTLIVNFDKLNLYWNQPRADDAKENEHTSNQAVSICGANSTVKSLAGPRMTCEFSVGDKMVSGNDWSKGGLLIAEELVWRASRGAAKVMKGTRAKVERAEMNIMMKYLVLESEL